MHKYFFLLYCISIMTSCTQESNKNEIIRKQIVAQTGITVPSFTLVSKKSSYAIGDYSESFLIKFSASEFKFLVKSIIKSKNYSDKIIPKTSVNVNELPIHRWQKYETGYKFEIYYPHNNKHIGYYINTTNQTLYYTSNEE